MAFESIARRKQTGDVETFKFARPDASSPGTDLIQTLHVVDVQGASILFATETTLQALVSKDYATQATLSAVDAKLEAIVLDTNNSTTIGSPFTVTPGTPYIGTATDLTASGGFQAVTMSAVQNAPGADGTLFFEFGRDGINWPVSIGTPLLNQAFILPLPLATVYRYFRVRCTAPSGSFTIDLETLLHRTAPPELTQLPHQNMVDTTPLKNVRSLLHAESFKQQVSQGFRNVEANQSGALLTADFLTEVALDNVAGFGIATKFGRVRDIDAADVPVDIWSFADDTAVPRNAQKVFPATADIIYITSDNALDTSEITAEVIDSTGALQIVTINLSGVVPVSTGINGLDINRLFVSGGTPATGTIYGTWGNDLTLGIPNDVNDVLAVAPAGYQQSQLSHFTVPLNRILVMEDLLITVARAGGNSGSAIVQLLIKEFGGSERVRREYFPTTSVPIINGIQNTVVPARAQIRWAVIDVSSADTNLSCVWGYKLVEV